MVMEFKNKNAPASQPNLLEKSEPKNDKDKTVKVNNPKLIVLNARKLHGINEKINCDRIGMFGAMISCVALPQTNA